MIVSIHKTKNRSQNLSESLEQVFGKGIRILEYLISADIRSEDNEEQ